MTNGDDKHLPNNTDDVERFADVIGRVAVAGGHGDIEACHEALDYLYDTWGGDGMTHAALTLARAFHVAAGIEALRADDPEERGYFAFNYVVRPVKYDEDGRQLDGDGNPVADPAAADAAMVADAAAHFEAERARLRDPAASTAPDNLAGLGDLTDPYTDAAVLRPLGDKGVAVPSDQALQASVAAMQFITAVANNDGDNATAILEVAAPNYGFGFIYALAQLAGQAWINRDENAGDVDAALERMTAFRDATAATAHGPGPCGPNCTQSSDE